MATSLLRPKDSASVWRLGAAHDQVWVCRDLASLIPDALPPPTPGQSLAWWLGCRELFEDAAWIKPSSR